MDVVDDLSTGCIENIDHLRGHPGFTHAIDSVMNRPLMAEMVDRADVVFHLAAAVGVRLVVEEPVRTIETNIRATEIVLELAAKKSKPVLIASTSEVYGKPTGKRFAEDDDVVLGPTSKSRWCYAASKMIDEFLGLAYTREKRLPVVVLRFFNTIGPRQTGQYGMVVPRFVRQALMGEPLTVYGDGSQSRSFTWVGDAVWASIALIDNPAAAGQVFNVGHTEEITMADLALLVKDTVGSDSEVVLVPFEDAYVPGFEDMPRRLPDISKIHRFTGYEPSMDLRQMLERIVADERARAGRAAAPSATRD